MHRITLFLIALLALVVSPAQASEPADGPDRIVAVGDLHGDFAAWQEIAREAGLVDRKGKWAGGETVFVQLGDLTDRGPDSLKIIRHLQQLQKEAEKAGGEVIVLIGNHEAMNVIGDLRYVHPGEYEAFRDRRSEARREATWKANREQLEQFYRASDPELTSDEVKDKWFAETPLGSLEHRRAWSPGGNLAEWAAGLPAIAKVGSTLFVHGGLSEEATQLPIEAINERVQAALKPGQDIDRSALEDPLGPLWYRGNVFREEVTIPEGEEAPPPIRPGREEELALVLDRYGADRIVVAHTPSREGIVDDLGGRLLRIDTGISAHYGGPASFLVIAGETVTASQKAGDGSWQSRSIKGPAVSASP